MDKHLFYQKLAESTDMEEYENYNVLITALNDVMQQRLLATIRRGFTLSAGYSLLYKGRAFPDKNYR